MQILVIDPSDDEVGEAACDLCGEVIEFHFAHVEDIADDDHGDSLDICHDCIVKMQEAIEHESRSK